MIEKEKFAPSLPDHCDPDDPSAIATELKVELAVTEACARARLNNLAGGKYWDGTHVLYALVLSDIDWGEWRRTRKRCFKIEGSHCWFPHAARLLGLDRQRDESSYRKLWKRLETAEKQGVLNWEMFEIACYYLQGEWQALVGSGRSKAFIYDGDDFPELKGQHFPSVVAFLIEIGRPELKQIVWSRQKNGWNLDDAIREEIMRCPGVVYCITCSVTGMKYVGLTRGTAQARFSQHLKSACQNGSLLAREIALRGNDAFELSILERVEDRNLLASREKYWIGQLRTLHPDGFNATEGGEISGGRGRKFEFEGVSYPSFEEASRAIGAERGLKSHVVAKRLRDGRPIPKKAREHSDHPDSKSSSNFNNLWRRWKSLLKRIDDNLVDYAIVETWRDYDNFKRDVADSQRPTTELIAIDKSLPIGPNNFAWVSPQEKVERISGKEISCHGTTFPTFTLFAAHYRIGRTTAFDRYRRGMSPEEIVDAGKSGRTSAKMTKFNGREFKSMTAAAKHAAETFGCTIDRARDRIRREIPLARWAEMDQK